MSAHQVTREIAMLLLELLTLKDFPRGGWPRARIPLAEQETVAGHSFGSGAIAMILAVLQGNDVDVGKAIMLAILHDIGETRSQDIAHPLRDILEQLGLPKDRVDQMAEELQRQDLPKWLQTFLRETLEESRKKETLEAKIAGDADLIDLGIQALLYQRRGHPTQEFVDGIDHQLQTDAGKRLWELIRGDPEIFTAWFSKQT